MVRYLLYGEAIIKDIGNDIGFNLIDHRYLFIVFAGHDALNNIFHKLIEDLKQLFQAMIPSGQHRIVFAIPIKKLKN